MLSIHSFKVGDKVQFSSTFSHYHWYDEKIRTITSKVSMSYVDIFPRVKMYNDKEAEKIDVKCLVLVIGLGKQFEKFYNEEA